LSHHEPYKIMTKSIFLATQFLLDHCILTFFIFEVHPPVRLMIPQFYFYYTRESLISYWNNSSSFSYVILRSRECYEKKADIDYKIYPFLNMD